MSPLSHNIFQKYNFLQVAKKFYKHALHYGYSHRHYSLNRPSWLGIKIVKEVFSPPLGMMSLGKYFCCKQLSWVYNVNWFFLFKPSILTPPKWSRLDTETTKDKQDIFILCFLLSHYEYLHQKIWSCDSNISNLDLPSIYIDHYWDLPGM